MHAARGFLLALGIGLRLDSKQSSLGRSGGSQVAEFLAIRVGSILRVQRVLTCFNVFCVSWLSHRKVSTMKRKEVKNKEDRIRKVDMYGKYDYEYEQ